MVYRFEEREGFKIAFKNFDVEKVAFTDKDVERLTKDTSIIRTAKKLKPYLQCTASHRDLKQPRWFRHVDRAPSSAVQRGMGKAFQKTKFTGGEIVNEFLMSIGYLQGAHRSDCPIFEKITIIVPACKRPNSERQP